MSRTAKPPPEGTPNGQTTGEPPAGGEGEPLDDPALGATGLTPEHVRNTPEYRELARQNRILARKAGEAERQAATARQTAEQVAQAAEAERVAAQEQRVREILGDDGVAMWDQFAELSTTDPVKAAELLAEFAKGKAQSQPPAAASPTPAAGGTQVPAQQPQQQPPASTGLSRSVGDAPLAGAPDDTAQVIEGLEKRYQDVVERNQNASTRNRVTMKDRAGALISYVGAAYLKAGARPKNP